jgi:hypothetical protein
VVWVEANIIGECFQIGLIEIEHSGFIAHKKSIPDFGCSYKRRIYEPMSTRSLDGGGAILEGASAIPGT